MKKIYILIYIALIITLMGCSNENVVEDKKIIAVSTIKETHGWVDGVSYYAEGEIKTVAEENNWDYIFVSASNSNEQSNQIIDLIDQNVDCIILLPMDGASLKTAASAVKKAGIPLVIFDREIPDFMPAATVKGDNPKIGVTTAEKFNDYFIDGTVILELMGDTSTVPFQRTAGYDETINDNFSKIQLGYTGWQISNSREIFREWVENSSQEEIDEIGAIFTHDDEIAMGVLDVIDEYENNEELKKTFSKLEVIASSSGSQKMFNRILEEEKIYLFSLTYSPKMINDAIRIGELIIKKESYEEMTIIGTKVVDRNNAKEFLDSRSPF